MEELKLNSQTYFSKSKFDSADSGTEDEDQEEEEPTKAKIFLIFLYNKLIIIVIIYLLYNFITLRKVPVLILRLLVATQNKTEQNANF